jgi:hypothetical protein
MLLFHHLIPLLLAIQSQKIIQLILNFNYGTTGIFDSSFWNSDRYWWVNDERSNITDKSQPHNINTPLTNNCNRPIEVLMIILSQNNPSFDFETGITSIS